ncbi:histidine ammonia-lyase [Fulvivirgaceae bacterium BMA12]|uniref:Histidine ammonia-lyase n=1 Tax=Agaribacillus aureus TaxID=3051825 RepID=A0ABT8LHG4_9BACT|nr:histidine ammonia-lyase [Fulvivirgaceae bacterium BMA12]
MEADHDHQQFAYGQDHLTAGKALEICSGKVNGYLNDATIQKVRRSEKIVGEIAGGDTVVYGINSGFGPLCTTKISAENTRELQSNILKSHSVGVGAWILDEVAKLMLILKVHALAQGYSGIRKSTLDRIIWHIDNNVIPKVPEQGSVGASGDLAPLSHLFLPLIGLGSVNYQGQDMTADSMLKKVGLEPLSLAPKEGLALINGTQFIAAFAVRVIAQMHQCLSQADVIAAMMIEGLLGSSQPFSVALHQVRPYAGTQHVAARIRKMLAGSAIVASHKDCERVQDPYSLRCIPQVHGASRNAWLHLKELLEIELNSVTDNPVIIDQNQAISGGNFHGQPMALPLDYVCLAAAELGNISDRRVYLSLEGNVAGLPKLLMKDTGLHSGFMILQYTTAALVSENKGLCFPASADSIPTSLGQEDHVSMGSIGGRKALKVIGNLEKILAIELLAACQALDFRRPLKSTPVIEAVHSLVRADIPYAERDRVFADDIQVAHQLIQSGAIIKAALKAEDNKAPNLKSGFDELFEVY